MPLSEKKLLLNSEEIVNYPGPQTYLVSGTNEFNISSISNLTMDGMFYQQTSDRPGYKKYRIYGSFNWSGRTLRNYTDGMSIGYPVTTQFVLPTSNGKVRDFMSNVCGAKTSSGSVTCKDYKTTPVIDRPGIGVGTTYNMSHMFYKTHGYIAQSIYTKQSGSANVLLRYASQKANIAVSFSFPNSGLSITPKWSNTTEDYVMTVNY